MESNTLTEHILKITQPPLYDKDSKYYYKNKYPNVVFPVDLEKSAGVFYTGPLFQSPISPTWGLFGLLNYMPQMANYNLNYQIAEQQGTHFYKHHTVEVNGIPVADFPPVSTILQMIELGKTQALAQIKKL